MIVIKLGGNALVAQQGSSWVEPVAEAFERERSLVLVHGGGPQIDAELKVHDIPKEVIGGYRVTDDATFAIVEMVLAGQVQQGLIRLLRASGVPAVGIAGSDGGLFNVRKKFGAGGVDLGHVGEIVGVRPALLEVLIAEGFLPVLSPVSSDENGVGFNVNADMAAGAVAGSLGADQAIFMTDVAGIFRNYPDEGSLIRRISLSELKDLLPVLAEGMIPKVEAVINALSSGARRAHVIDGRNGQALKSLLEGKDVGTEVVHD